MSSSGSSSLFASWGSSLLPSRRRPSPPSQFCSPELKAFESDCASRLDHLQPSSSSSSSSHEFFMSSAWLCRALDVVLITHASMEAFVPGLQQALANGHIKWLDSYLDDSSKLLDTCNVLRDAIADMREYHACIDLAVQSFKDGMVGRSQLRRAQSALCRCAGALKKKGALENRSKLDKCSSTLRRMGEKLSATQQQHAPKGSSSSSFFVASCAAQSTTVFICGMVASALSVRSRRPLTFVPSSAHPCASWASSFGSLQRSVKELALAEKNKGKGVLALLAELEMTDTEASALDGCISKALHDMGSCGSLIPRHALDVRRHLGVLQACSDDLGEGLASLETHIDKLYKVLVATRMALLEIYSCTS